MKTLGKIGLGIATGALLFGGVGGFASLASAEPTATPTPTASTADATAPGSGMGMGGRHGGMRGEERRGGEMRGGDMRGGEVRGAGDLAAKLADKLGVDEAQVSAALEKVHETMRNNKPTDQGTRPDPATMQSELEKALASELGVDEAKVTDALTAIRSERQADVKSGFQARLDQAVTDGKLTQSDADSVMKAADAGVIGYGGGRGHR